MYSTALLIVVERIPKIGKQEEFDDKIYFSLFQVCQRTSANRIEEFWGEYSPRHPKLNVLENKRGYINCMATFRWICTFLYFLARIYDCVPYSHG